MNLSVEIPNKGTLVGSCGWVKKQIENCSLSIYRSKGQHFCIGVKFKGEEIFTTVALIHEAFENEYKQYYYNESYDTYEVWEQETTEDYYLGRKSLFGNLTKSAEKYVTSFLSACSSELRSFVDNDEEIPYELEIVAKK